MLAFTTGQLTKTLAVLSYPGNKLFLRQSSQHPQSANTPHTECVCLLLSEIKNRERQRSERVGLFTLCDDLNALAGRHAHGKANSRIKIPADDHPRRYTDRAHTFEQLSSEYIGRAKQLLCSCYIHA